MSAARFKVAGKVQGVFFRASTRERAQALGLTGFARNLADGSVDVLAVGKSEAINQLEAWLRQGPSRAEVSQLLREDVAEPQLVPRGFEIG